MSIADGRPGIEATHTWGSFVLNDRHPAAPARVLVDRITGFYSLSEADDQRMDAGSRRGEIVLPSRARGKTVVYEGRIEAKTLVAWRQTYRGMLGAFRGRNVEGSMLINGDPDWLYYGRVLQLDADDSPDDLSQTRRWPFRGGFQLGLRMSDARFYVADLVQHHSGDGAAVTNLGTTDTDPTFLLSVSSAGDVSLYNAAIDKVLTFRDVPTGTHTLVFGPGRRAFAAAGGADLTGLVDPAASTWWDEDVPGLVPGVNTLTITGTSSWRCDYRHADE